MGRLQVSAQRRAMKAAGGLFSAAAKKLAGPALRAVPGVGTAMSIGSIGMSMLPKKPTFGLGLATGMAAGPATRTAASAASKVTQRVTQAWTGKKKYRRQNVGNMKALRRAIRRIQGAEKLFRTVLSVQGKSHTGIKPKRK